MADRKGSSALEIMVEVCFMIVLLPHAEECEMTAIERNRPEVKYKVQVEMKMAKIQKNIS